MSDNISFLSYPPHPHPPPPPFKVDVIYIKLLLATAFKGTPDLLINLKEKFLKGAK